MRLDFGAQVAQGRAAGPVARVDPRVRLLVTVGFVVGVVLTPPGAWRVLAVEGLLLAGVVGWAGVEPATLGLRWLRLAPLVGFLAVMIAPGHPARAELGIAGVVAAIVAKNSLALGAMATLILVTPFPTVLAALGRLGVPTVLVATLRFMERQAQILGIELGRMVQARRCRTFRRSGRLGFGVLAGLVGMLFLRSFERGERVHAAMLARGWDGTVRTLDGPDAIGGCHR